MNVTWSRIRMLTVVVLSLVTLELPSVLQTSVLSVRVLRRVVPTDAKAIAEGEYLSGVLHGLGFRGGPPSVPLDPALTDKVSWASEASMPWRLLASYALLASPPDLDRADQWLARARGADRDLPIAALWRGRLLWVRGDRTGALHEWYSAFGTDYLPRKRLVDALYTAKEMPLAIDATMSLFTLPGVGDALRRDAFDRLRYWMFQRSGGETALSLEWCDRILAHRSLSPDPATFDREAADIIALRARWLYTLDRHDEALTALAYAERIRNSGFVQSVRSWERFRAGSPHEALDSAAAAVEAAGADGHALLLAGHVLRELGDRAGAMRAWRLAVERDALLASAAEGRIAVDRGER